MYNNHSNYNNRDEYKNEYKGECVVHCTDKGKDLSGEILSFKPGKFLKILIASELRVTMEYVQRHNIYVGSTQGLEFTSKGPALSK